MMKVAKHGGNIYEVASALGLAMEEILDFSANINPLGIPESLKAAIVDNIHIIERYPDPEYGGLVKAIADYHGVDQQWIAVGNGATELIFALAASLNSKNSLILAPTFSEYERALLKAKSEVHYYYLKEENDFQVDEGFKKMLNSEIDLLILCNPNNPTGQFLKRQQMMEILRQCREHGIRLVVDEAFIDFVAGGEMETMITAMHEYKHLYVVRALTKFFAIPGLRLGYAVASNENILRRMHDNREPWTINSLAALAGEIILKDEDYIQATKNWIEQERNNLFKALNDIEGIKVYKPEANYIFFSSSKNDRCLKEALLEKKILIRSCSNYKNLTDRFYRVAIKDSASNEKLVQALKEVIYES